MAELSPRTELAEARFVQEQITEAKVELNGKRAIIENELSEMMVKIDALGEALTELKLTQSQFGQAKEKINGKVAQLEAQEKKRKI